MPIPSLEDLSGVFLLSTVRTGGSTGSRPADGDGIDSDGRVPPNPEGTSGVQGALCRTTRKAALLGVAWGSYTPSSP
jgi:hypothetical protein